MFSFYRNTSAVGFCFSIDVVFADISTLFGKVGQFA